MAPLLPVARQLLDIALLRRGPQDLPYSPTLLVLAISASALASLVARGASGMPLLSLVLIVAYTAAFLHGVLQMRQLTARFVQTATAVFGTDALITLVALPLLGAFTASGTQPAAGALLAYLALVAWNVAVLAHILRNALDTGLGKGALWAVAYIAGTAFIAGIGAGPQSAGGGG
jgi:hypothetical protein